MKYYVKTHAQHVVFFTFTVSINVNIFSPQIFLIIPSTNSLSITLNNKHFTLHKTIQIHTHF